MPKDVRSPLRTVSAMGLRAQCDSTLSKLEDTLEAVRNSQRRESFSQSVADIRFECGAAVATLVTTLRPTVEGWLGTLGPRATAGAVDMIDEVTTRLKSILSRVLAAECALDAQEHAHETAHTLAMECVEAFKYRSLHAEDVVEANFSALRDLESTLAQSREYVATVMQERVEWQARVGPNPVHLPIIENHFMARCEQASKELSTVTSPKWRRDWPSVTAADCVTQRFTHSSVHSARGACRYVRPQEELQLLQRLLGRGSDDVSRLQDEAERRQRQRERMIQTGTAMRHIVLGIRSALEDLRHDMELIRDQFFRTMVMELHQAGAGREQSLLRPEQPKKRASVRHIPQKPRRESAINTVRSVAPFPATDASSDNARKERILTAPLAHVK